MKTSKPFLIFTLLVAVAMTALAEIELLTGTKLTK